MADANLNRVMTYMGAKLQPKWLVKINKITIFEAITIVWENETNKGEPKVGY